MDTELLSRLQFAFTVSLHIIFPSLSIGLALFLAIVEFLWLRTRDLIYLRIYRFWSTIFSMGFGMGVISGIVLSFEFGLNFSKFAQTAGPIIGPVIGLEVVSAFFLEAGFLGIMLFGWDRVPPRVHFASTALVAIGTTISASFIMSANSWMQHPVGYHVAAGRFVADDWWTIIDNPEWPLRLAHMLLGAWTASFAFVAGVAALYLLQKRHIDFAKKTFNIATGTLAVLVWSQLVMGLVLTDTAVAKYQPEKALAFEGHWDDAPAPAPYNLIIVPDQAHQRNTFEFGIPGLGSLFVHHDLTEGVPGEKRFPRNRQPPVGLVFYSFRVMFLLGVAIALTSLYGLYLRVRNRLYESRAFLLASVWLAPAGFVCILAGWYAAEIGRQPWVIYGVLRTADAITPLPAGAVLATLAAFIAVYTTLFSAFIALTWKVVAAGPDETPYRVNPSGTVRRAFIPGGSATAGAVEAAVGSANAGA